MEVTVDLDVCVKCYECNSDLSVRRAEADGGVATIEVERCDDCAEEARKEGYEKGLEDAEGVAIP